MTFAVFKESLREKIPGAIILASLLFLLLLLIGRLSPAPGSSPEGGHGLSMFFSILGLVVGGYVAILAASFVSGEIERRTCDILMTLPVTRTNIVISRLAVLVPVIAIICIAVYLGVFAGAKSVSVDYDMTWIGYAVMFMAIFGMAAGALSIFISALLSDTRSAILVSLGVLIAMFLVEMVGSTVARSGWIMSLSLFHYLEINDIMGPHIVHWPSLGVLAVAAVLFSALAVIAFRRRDIQVT